MSLLEETPSKQFVIPKEVYTPSLPPSFSSLTLVMPCFSYTYNLSHHTHTHTHTLQVGSMVVYLCSEDARQVTGSTLTIDGGWTTR